MNPATIPDLAVAASMASGFRLPAHAPNEPTGGGRPAETALSEARRYASRGWAVFPIRHGHKTPLTSHGLHDAVKDLAQLPPLFPDSQRRNIGIATGRKSGIVVIDIDSYRGGDLSALERELGRLPETREARTRAGGRHLYFRCPSDAVIRSHNGVLAPHVDVKAEGGYVVAPSSYVEADDKGPAGRYVWVNQLPLADLSPAWVQRLSTLGQRSTTRETNDDLTAGVVSYRPPEQAAEGQRNEAVLRYVGSLRGKGLDEAAILQAAHDFNRSRCVPPLEPAEVCDIAARYAQQAPSDTSAWPDPKPIEAPLPLVPAFDPQLLPDALSPFVADQADLMQCPPEYIAVPLMVSAGAALGNKIAITPKAKDTSWLVVPVLWGAVVGRPGSLKSPAQDVGVRPLAGIEADLMQAYDTKRQQYHVDKLQYEAAMAAAKRAASKGQGIVALPIEPEQPQPERLVVNDSTVQKLGEILRWSPQGVLVVRDELVS